jgi:hypothetical protein
VFILSIKSSFFLKSSLSFPDNGCVSILWKYSNRQRSQLLYLAACTCPGEPHPGPARADGTYVGRAAPEIDILEAIVENGEGHVSLSAQWAPYNVSLRSSGTSGCTKGSAGAIPSKQFLWQYRRR